MNAVHEKRDATNVMRRTQFCDTQREIMSYCRDFRFLIVEQNRVTSPRDVYGYRRKRANVDTRAFEICCLSLVRL